MANPAIKRSGSAEHDPDFGQEEEDSPGTNAFTMHTTADLIALRDDLLARCLDLEQRGAKSDDAGGETSDDPALVRERMDEIHQELALRDLAERVGNNHSRLATGTTVTENPPPATPRLSAHAVRKSIQILEAIEMRSRFMDELAQAAREKGRLDQAATFTLNAQKLDMERVAVLSRLGALSETTDTDE